FLYGRFLALEELGGDFSHGERSVCLDEAVVSSLFFLAAALVDPFREFVPGLFFAFFYLAENVDSLSAGLRAVVFPLPGIERGLAWHGGLLDRIRLSSRDSIPTGYPTRGKSHRQGAWMCRHKRLQKLGL